MDGEWALLIKAKAGAAADRKHLDILARVTASLKASRDAVRRLQQRDQAKRKRVPPPAL